MSAAFVGEAETWATPVSGVMPLRVMDDSGELANMFTPTSSEVTLIGPLDAEKRRLVVSIAFSTHDQGLRAGKILADALSEVEAIQAEAPPDPTTCVHQTRTQRFSRMGPRLLVCDLCCANLGEV